MSESGSDRITLEDVVTDRDPSEMEYTDLLSEWKDAQGVYYERSLDADEDDLLFSRIQQLWSEMERRVEPEYPACSECGDTETWAQSPGEPLHCTSCGFAETDEETIEAVHAAWSRLTDPEADEAGDRDE